MTTKNLTEAAVKDLITSTLNGTPRLTEGAVTELIDAALRTALTSQARELEQHLKDLHERVQRLERGA
jgi:hypothetical protein|tara:strand:+ start:143 stop:346 length:204 start_codon:yes stop_codon:yes gene_type:complete